MPEQAIVVIGGGVVGVCCAVQLQREGHKVTVLEERAGPGEGCSYGNAGSISPDMVVPIAMPGMLAKVPGWLTDPLGPLAIAPRHFPRALPWLLRWVAAGRMPEVRKASAALRTLHRPVFDIYRELLGARFHETIHTTGQLYVWRGLNPSRPEIIAQELRAAAGVRTEAVSAEDLRQMEPGLARDFRRGLYFPDNGHTSNPGRLVRLLAEVFQSEGGRIVRGTAIGFDVRDRTVAAMRTSDGVIAADAFVVAAGAYSQRLVRLLGVSVPLESERGYHVTLPDPGIAVRNKLSNREDSFAITEMEDGIRIAGTVEIAGLDAPPVEARAHVLLRAAQRMFPGIRLDGYRIWMGHRPSTPDSVPVIDRAPGIANLHLAFGHGHTGMTGAPMTGRLIADLVAGRPSTIDRSPYGADRFALFGPGERHAA